MSDVYQLCYISLSRLLTCTLCMCSVCELQIKYDILYILYLWLYHLHAVHQMRLIAADVTSLYVCMTVSWSHWCAVQKWLNQSYACIWELTHVGPRCGSRSDESIRSRWQVGDAAFCQITLGICCTVVVTAVLWLRCTFTKICTDLCSVLHELFL